MHHSIILQNAWNKYGQLKFSFEVLEMALKPKLIEREQLWIDVLKAFGKSGYNINPRASSSLGRKLTEEHKKKISLGNLGNLVTKKQEQLFLKLIRAKKELLLKNLKCQKLLKRGGRIVLKFMQKLQN